MSQIQTVLVQGLYISKGEFTPENGKNKGIPTPYDNLNIHAAIPFPAENMDAKGCKNKFLNLKVQAISIVLKMLNFLQCLILSLNLISLAHRQNLYLKILS